MSYPPPPPPGPVYPHYPTPPQNPWLPKPPQRNRSMAIWALCLSWIPLFVPSAVAVGLGIAVLVRSRRDKVNHGKVMAIIAIVIGVVIGGFIGTVVMVGVYQGVRDARIAEQPTTQDGTLIDDLRTGDCFMAATDLLDENGAKIPDRVHVVACTSTHRYQVYAVSPIPSGSRPQILTRAENFCRAHDDAVLDTHTGHAWEPGYLYGRSVRTHKPSVQCLIYRSDLTTWLGSAVRPGGSTAPNGNLDAGPTTQT